MWHSSHTTCIKASIQTEIKIVIGQQPLTLSTVAMDYQESSLSTYKFAREWPEQVDLARTCLHKALKRMKKWADKKWWHAEFQVEDLVLAKLHLVLRYKDVHKGLICRYEGSFQVLQWVGKAAYKLELSLKLKVHPMFHVSMLRPFHVNEED